VAVRLDVKNLPYWFTDEELLAVFAPHGTVLSVNVIPPLMPLSPASGIVEMATEEEAERAKEAVDGAELLGYMLQVERRDENELL
jgi:RNA recognition motif-containing protein